MEFINVLEDSYELYELCKQEEWTTAEDYDEFVENGGELAFFEGDPDIIKIDGEIGYFCEMGNKVFYYFDEFHGEAKSLLKAFFGAFETGISMGGWSWLSGENPEGFEDVEGGWDAWDKISTGIAYRGGAGYSYALLDCEKYMAVNA